MKHLVHPTYFPNIESFGILTNNQVIFEAEDNFQKQTYRNRMYIYGPNGKQLLGIPIQHNQNKNSKQKYRDTLIDYKEDWQKIHWRSLEAAYRTSPFFEFYEHELLSIYQKKEKFLFDLNLKTIEVIFSCLDIEFTAEKTTDFEAITHTHIDVRSLVNAKNKSESSFKKYIQVFAEKHGFISNLSILDLLFSEGPNTVSFLKKQA